jgi:hypothetical protein
VVGLILVPVASSALWAQAPDSGGSKPADLRQSLLGAWVLVGPPGSTGEPRPDAQMKFWGLNDFAVTKPNPATGKIEYHHVGTYTLNGDQYSETITSAVGTTESLVGRTFKFRIEIKGDTYIQHGLDNPWNEQWTRSVIKPVERDAPKK